MNGNRIIYLIFSAPILLLWASITMLFYAYQMRLIKGFLLFVCAFIFVPTAILKPILLLSAAITMLLYAYKKGSIKGLLLLICTFIFVPIGMLKFYERQFSLQMVPDALGVTSISSRNESWGFGPGGNSAGILFYPLSEDVSRKVTEGGIAYFKAMPPNENQSDREWRGRYGQWNETPLQGESWKINPNTRLLNVRDYICKYVGCTNIPSEILNQANEIVSTPGSFYAYAQIGIIVVSPREKVVLYFYNG